MTELTAVLIELMTNTDWNEIASARSLPAWHANIIFITLQIFDSDETFNEFHWNAKWHKNRIQLCICVTMFIFTEHCAYISEKKKNREEKKERRKNEEI